MKVFSTHRKKLEPKRRFGGQEFRSKVKSAANYKRVLNYRPKFSWKIWRYVAGFVVVVIVYYLCISSRFVVANVSVSGNVQVSTQQIQDAIISGGSSRVFLIKKTNLFLLTQGRLNQLLTSAIPTVKSVTSYKRIWPNTIQVGISEHVPGFVIDSNNQYFLIDEEGTVVSEITDPKNLLVVYDDATEDFATGETLSNVNLAAFVVSMSHQWDAKVSSPIAQVKFPGKGSTDVEFVSAVGWTAFFDTTRPVVDQLADLALLLNKQISAKDQANLAYIDLRLSTLAYYCFKSTPCSQAPTPQDSGTTTTNATTTTTASQ